MIGTMVILYDNSPEEIWEADMKQIQRRLYKITGLSLTNRRMVIVHQQEARQATDLKKKQKPMLMMMIYVQC